MFVAIHEPYGTTNRENISRLESVQQIKLPEDYVLFLLRTNGGYPEPDGFIVPNWSNHASSVNRFFGIHDGKFSNLEKECADYANRIPSDLVPIASDPGGNLICLGVSGASRGKVYFWDHEDELDEEGCSRMDFRNAYFLADSFDDFLSKLCEEPT